MVWDLPSNNLLSSNLLDFQSLTDGLPFLDHTFRKATLFPFFFYSLQMYALLYCFLPHIFQEDNPSWKCPWAVRLIQAVSLRSSALFYCTWS
jgi:hypothetical protein